MQVSIDINPKAEEQLKKSFLTNDVKLAIETLVNKFVDKYAQEREIAENVIQGIKEVREGKAKDIKELLSAI